LSLLGSDFLGLFLVGLSVTVFSFFADCTDVISSSTGAVGVFDDVLFEADDEILGTLLLEEEDEIVVELMLVDEEEDKILAALLFEELGVLCNDAMGVFTVT
jgi:hypothetical protein